MPRVHRLKPNPVSEEAILHGYASPPIPEKGCPPTVIVTPPEPASAGDFELHFYSKVPMSTFTTPSYYVRVKSGLQNLFSFSVRSTAKADSQQGSFVEEKELILETPSTTAITTAAWGSLPAAELGYTSVPCSDEEEGLIRLTDDDNEEDSDELNAYLDSLQARRSLSATRTRRMRIALMLGLPIAVVGFHLISHQMGFGITPFDDSSSSH